MRIGKEKKEMDHQKARADKIAERVFYAKEAGDKVTLVNEKAK